MEICKAPTLRLKTLNKHTHIMYIEMENVIQFFFLMYIYINKCSSIIVPEETRGTVCVDRGHLPH